MQISMFEAKKQKKWSLTIGYRQICLDYVVMGD